MTAIIVRQRATGEPTYTARIKIKQGGKLVHDEAKTFTREALAKDWRKRRLAEIRSGLVSPGTQDPAAPAAMTVGRLIDWYIAEFQPISAWQRTKSADLKRLKGMPIAQMPAEAVTAQTLVAHVRDRRAAGAGPATAGNDLTWLAVVMKAGKGVLGLPLRPEAAAEARTTCRQLRLVGKSKMRDRRPTADELKKLDWHFASRDRRARIPMRDIMLFAIHSARREAEICRIEWADNDAKGMTGIVRDAKHPRAKLGNHRTFKYTAEGWKIANRQPKTSPYIFPYDPKSVGAAFTRACKILGIEDLHFHDLRHEATSRLFEAGYDIPQVALFTLHDSWKELKRYANLRPADMALR